MCMYEGAVLAVARTKVSSQIRVLLIIYLFNWIYLLIYVSFILKLCHKVIICKNIMGKHDCDITPLDSHFSSQLHVILLHLYVFRASLLYWRVLGAFYWIKENNNIIPKQLNFKEKCSTGWGQTLASHNPDECPNQLDHQHYWLFLVALIKVFYWSDLGPWPLQLPSTDNLFSASAHLICTFVGHLHNCSAHLLRWYLLSDKHSQLFHCIELRRIIILFLNN